MKIRPVGAELFHADRHVSFHVLLPDTCRYHPRVLCHVSLSDTPRCPTRVITSHAFCVTCCYVTRLVA